jgi:hypothetical protein
VPTLAQYRRSVEAALDDGGVYQLSSGSGTGGAASALSDATTNASASRYNGAWVYLATGAGTGQQRRIRNDSLTPSTGAFLTELGWTVPAAGDEIEITHLFPCVFGPDFSGGVGPEDTSYLILVNHTLAQLWAPDRVSLAFAGTATASTSAWPWLDHPDRLVRVLEPAPVAGFPVVSCAWRNPQLILDGPTPVLQLNRPFTGTLILEVKRPGHTLISGAESMAGLASEGQTALPSVEDVTVGALAQAYRALMNRSPGRPHPGADKKYADAREQFESLYYYDRTRFARQQPQPEAA